jgi:ribose/xylose/arabinose/galactoside ABC-type transport system permease subunit
MLATCTLVGVANGLMVVKLRMNNFMVTLGMSIFLAGMSLIISGGRQVTTIPDDFRFLGATQIPLASNLKFPISVLFLLLLLAVAHVTFTRTIFGRSLYAVGSNRRAARAAGIDTGRVIIGAYAISGFICGIGAWLLVGRLGASSPGISSGALFISFAAAVIGGVSLFGGRGSATGVLGGLLLIGVITNALNIANISGSYTQVAYGLIILSAVFVDGLRSRRIRAE